MLLEGLAQKTSPPPPRVPRARAKAEATGTVTLASTLPGAAPVTHGRPVLAPDPVCPRRRRRLRLVAAWIGMWTVFVHLMVTTSALM